MEKEPFGCLYKDPSIPNVGADTLVYLSHPPIIHTIHQLIVAQPHTPQAS